MEAGLGDPKDGGYTRYEKDDDCRPSEAPELLRHKFMGYVLSVTAFPVKILLHRVLQRHFGHALARPRSPNRRMPRGNSVLEVLDASRSGNRSFICSKSWLRIGRSLICVHIKIICLCDNDSPHDVLRILGASFKASPHGFCPTTATRGS
jgi:hypothetical protein